MLIDPAAEVAFSKYVLELVWPELALPMLLEHGPGGGVIGGPMGLPIWVCVEPIPTSEEILKLLTPARRP